jgi:hypothetical protein
MSGYNMSENRNIPHQATKRDIQPKPRSPVFIYVASGRYGLLHYSIDAVRGQYLSLPQGG